MIMAELENQHTAEKFELPSDGRMVLRTENLVKNTASVRW